MKHNSGVKQLYDYNKKQKKKLKHFWLPMKRTITIYINEHEDEEITIRFGLEI